MFPMCGMAFHNTKRNAFAAVFFIFNGGPRHYKKKRKKAESLDNTLKEKQVKGRPSIIPCGLHYLSVF